MLTHDKQTPGNLLIVDDEQNIRSGLQAVLSKQGYHIKVTDSAEEALKLLASYDCEVAIVDIRLPGMSGLALLETVRERWPHISIIMLTGHGALESAMAAVKAGAHDYLLKPAQAEEIQQTVAKALVVSRRRQEQARLLTSLRTSLQRLQGLPVTPAREFRIGDLFIDLRAHEVTCNGIPIPLTPSEFKLLVTLASHEGQVVDYATLVKESLSYEIEAGEAKELIKRHIFALRQKIEPDPASPQYIVNVRSVGYRLASP
jgi:DNA-binding response OmpR family regulator